MSSFKDKTVPVSPFRDRFSVGRKLAATAAILMGPLFLLAYLHVVEMNKRVAETRVKMRGLEVVGAIDDGFGMIVSSGTDRLAGDAELKTRVMESLSLVGSYFEDNRKIGDSELSSWLEAVQAIGDGLDGRPNRLIDGLEGIEEIRVELAKDLDVPSFFARDLFRLQLSLFELGSSLDAAILADSGAGVAALIGKAESLFTRVRDEYGDLLKLRAASDHSGAASLIQGRVSESWAHYRTVEAELTKRLEVKRRLAFLGILGQEDRSSEAAAEVENPSRRLLFLIRSHGVTGDGVRDFLEKEVAERQETFLRERAWVVGLAGLAAVGACFFGYFISKSIRLSHESIHSYNRTLQQKVDEGVSRANASRIRTEELNKDLLAQTQRANEMAQKAIHAERLKSEFLANMSHEIRTPMNGVIGMTHLLLDTELDETQREFLKTMENSTESLLVLINDILDLSKIDAGKMTIEMIACDFVDLQSQLSSLFASTALEKGVEFVSMYPLGCDTMYLADPHRIRQVLSNLLSNAIKFTECGEVVLAIDIAKTTTGKARLSCEVVDSGIGIAPEAIETLFAAFSQADASTTRRFGGTGLGLAISERLVRLMGGTLEVESELGKGTRFSFSIELDAVEETPAYTLARGSHSIRNRNTICCMRQGALRDNLESMLSFFGGSFEWCEDMGALSERGRSSTFDVAILDARLCSESSLKGIIASLPYDTIGVIHLPSDKLSAACVAERRNAVSLVLPLSPESVLSLYEGAKKPISVDVVEPSTSSHDYASLKVLLVDDNVTNRLVAGKMLLKCGIDAKVVESGADAVAACGQTEFDLIFMDCMMPEMDGYETTGLIRSKSSQSRNIETPIIALTANAMEGDREKCLRAGMSDYIAKPIRPKELRAILEKWTSGLCSRDQSSLKKETSGEDSSEMLVDLSELINVFGDSADELRPLVDAFVESLGDQLSAIEGNEGPDLDFKTLRLHCHTIKGASANYGAKPLERIAKQVETACIEAEHERALELMPELKLLVERTISAANKSIA